MATTRTLMTAEELAALPDDGLRHELVAGELRTMSPTKPLHGLIVGLLTELLSAHARSRSLGFVLGAETGFRLARDPDTVRAPDVALVRREQLEKVGAINDWWPGAPDLAAEVLSPSDSYSEVREKTAAWLAAGARLVLVVDPRRRLVEVHRPDEPVATLGEADTLDGGEVVPGWSVPVAALFAWPTPPGAA